METQTSNIKDNTRLKIILGAIILLLTVPLIAMQFTKEVMWTFSDFIVAGVLLFSAGISLEFVLRKFKTPKHRLIFCAVVVAIFLMIWVELAVGIFGSPFAGS